MAKATIDLEIVKFTLPRKVAFALIPVAILLSPLILIGAAIGVICNQFIKLSNFLYKKALTRKMPALTKDFAPDIMANPQATNGQDLPKPDFWQDSPIVINDIDPTTSKPSNAKKRSLRAENGHGQKDKNGPSRATSLYYGSIINHSQTVAKKDPKAGTVLYSDGGLVQIGLPPKDARKQI